MDSLFEDAKVISARLPVMTDEEALAAEVKTRVDQFTRKRQKTGIALFAYGGKDVATKLVEVLKSKNYVVELNDGFHLSVGLPENDDEPKEEQEEDVKMESPKEEQEEEVKMESPPKVDEEEPKKDEPTQPLSNDDE